MLAPGIPTIVYWQMERYIVDKAPLLDATYRQLSLVPPHILFPALEQYIDEQGKREFLRSIVDGHFYYIINQPHRLN